MRLYILLAIFVLAVSIYLLQSVALAEFLYWRWWWFDVLMHFLGGVLIGGIALIVSEFVPLPRIVTFVSLLIVIGVGWELFERIYGLYNSYGYVADTIIDLCMDTLGVLVVYSGVKLWK